MDTINDDNNSFIQDFKDDMKKKRAFYIDWATRKTEKNDKFKNHKFNIGIENAGVNIYETKYLTDLNLSILTDKEIYDSLESNHYIFDEYLDKYYIVINIINKSNYTNLDENNMDTKQALSNIIEEDYLLEGNSIHFFDQQMEFIKYETNNIKIPAFGLDKKIDYSLIENLNKKSTENLLQILAEGNFYINNLLEYLAEDKYDINNLLEYIDEDDDEGNDEGDDDKGDFENFTIHLLSNKTLSIDEQMEGMNVFDFIENKRIRDKYDLLLKKIINNLNKVLKINTVYSLIIIKKEEKRFIIKNSQLLDNLNYKGSNRDLNTNEEILKKDINHKDHYYFTELNDGNIMNNRIPLEDIINEYKISDNIYNVIETKINGKMQGNTFQGFLNDFMISLNMEGFENKGTTILNIFICLILIFLIYQMNK